MSDPHRSASPSAHEEELQATPFDPDAAALGESDRLIERIDEKHLSIPAIPGLPEPWRAQIEVGSNLLEKRPQIHVQFVQSRSSPVPVAVIDAEDPKSWLQNERMRDHRIVRVRELLNVQVVLHSSLGIPQKRPWSAKGISELVQSERVVSADNDKPRVGDAELRITLDQGSQKSMLLGVIPSSGQMEDHRVATLQLRESPKDATLVLELVIRKCGPNNDVFTHPVPSLRPLRRLPEAIVDLRARGHQQYAGCALQSGDELGDNRLNDRLLDSQQIAHWCSHPYHLPVRWLAAAGHRPRRDPLGRRR